VDVDRGKLTTLHSAHKQKLVVSLRRRRTNEHPLKRPKLRAEAPE
jgi:hypothetical protein